MSLPAELSQCAACGGRLRILAALTDPPSIRRYPEGQGCRCGFLLPTARRTDVRFNSASYRLLGSDVI